MKSTRTPRTKCPSCSYEYDTASGFPGRGPKPGDVSICLRCGHLMGFNPDMTTRPLTDDEMLAVAGDKRLLAIQEARGHVKKDGEQ